MRNLTLILIALLLNCSNYAMLARARCPRSTRLPALTQTTRARIAPRRPFFSLDKTAYPETTKLFWDEKKMKDILSHQRELPLNEVPLPHRSYSNIGKHVFCHLVALRIIHFRHMVKNGKDKQRIGPGTAPQVVADDWLGIAINKFSETFINPSEETNYHSQIFKEEELTSITDKDLAYSIKLALEHLEKSFSDPHNKI